MLRVSFSLVHCLLPFSFTFHLSFLPHFLPAFLPSCLFLPSSNLLPSLHLTFRLASLTFRFGFLCFLCFKQSMCSNLPPSTRFPAGELCDRPIIGIYDYKDHDWGWNDGNSRLPDKDAYKLLYLDALGVAADSPRRKAFRGAYEKFSYKSGSAASPKVVEVFLLDERYDRSPLPCHVRRDWCTSEVLPFPDHNRWGWCNDYVNDGNCCSLDEEICSSICSQVLPRSLQRRRSPLRTGLRREARAVGNAADQGGQDRGVAGSLDGRHVRRQKVELWIL